MKLLTLPFLLLTSSAATAPPIPGLADVCEGFTASQRCSPEICNLQPWSFVQLGAKTYYHDRSIAMPEGVRLVGRGINHTIIVACGAPSSGRRGFILGNHSYLGRFTWQGLQASRGGFDAAIQTPGCASTGACDASQCIPAGAGYCAGVENATAEHIHVRPHVSDDGDWWPLSTSAGWFPHTAPWGPRRATGSRNITLRGIVSWGTWADGINFHGGHHNVLIEDCEMSYTGDDPYGLWPVSAEAKADPNDCQMNIVLRNNIGRWPRGYPGMSSSSKLAPRDFPDCDCSDAPKNCYSHSCFATYAGGAGIQWINNHCEGAQNFLSFYGDFPDPSKTKWCGPLTIAGNTYSAMAGQGHGCRAGNDNSSFCGGQPTVPLFGGQCGGRNEPVLPPPCSNATANPLLGHCEEQPGVGAMCYNASGAARCVYADHLAQIITEGKKACEGFESVCAIR